MPSLPVRGVRPPSRRLRLAIASIAALATIGDGIASTAAAWTDRSYLRAPASAATANLVGAVDGATWQESSSASGIALAFPVAALAPYADEGGAKSVARTLTIKNTGTTTVTVSAIDVATAGALFTGTAPVTVSRTGTLSAGGTIAAGATKTVIVTASAPNWTGTQHQNQTGTITVTVRGTVS